MAAAFLLAALALGPLLADTSGTAGPFYTADSIANTAASVAAFYAPDTLITIYGQNLGYVTRQIAADDIHGGLLPTVLIGTGVRVLVNQIEANIYYVSPAQVNLLIPPLLVAGPATVQLVVDGLAGPPVGITLGPAAPALFQVDARTVVATHADSSVVTQAAPAHGGELIVLYASGLGPTVPPAIKDQIPKTAAPLARMSDFKILLNGAAVDPSRVSYAGVAPGYAGLFQINVKLPENVASNPEIRIGYGDQISPAERFLPVQ
jgi:uncharacterized protein (TIGR03437 family)